LKKSAKARSRSKPKRSKLNALRHHPAVKFFLVLFGFWAFIGLVIALIISFHYYRLAGHFDMEEVARIPMKSQVLDGTGEMIGYLHGENVGTPVPLGEVSPHFVNALIAREDARFWKHNGVDYAGLIRAWARNTKENRLVQGASTITMQLTRMTFGQRERSVRRKLLEMAIARRIERKYSKEQILTFYINRVFLGTGMNGIQQAADGYFGKNASELTLPEAAMIAGIIRAPNGFSPFRHPDTSLREMKSTLKRMVVEDFLSTEDAEMASNIRPRVLPQERWMGILKQSAKVTQRSMILDIVERKLGILLPSLGDSGGLRIETAFDMRLQKSSEEAVEKHLSRLESLGGYSHPIHARHQSGDPEYLQAASITLENQTGAVRALVGGRNYSHSAFNRAVLSNRQVGSIFKPLVYATAFEKGLFPGMVVSDSKIQPGEIKWDHTDWNPKNSDEKYHRFLKVETGLIKSRNTMSVRVGERAGIENVLTMMDQAGLGKGRKIEPNPTIYIGNIGASVYEIASAYSLFATGGIRYEPYFIEKISDRNGKVLYKHIDESYQVVSPGAAWITSNILKRVLEQGGTGSRLRDLGFTAPAGGKTGTTNDFFDAWFVGFTSRLTTGVWIGLDQPATINSNAYGGRVAVPVWKDIMQDAADVGYQFEKFAAPEEVIGMNLCRHSGQLAKEECEKAGTVYVEQVPHDLIPRKFCKKH